MHELLVSNGPIEGARSQGIATKGHPETVELDELVEARPRLRYRLWNVKGGLRYCFDLCYPLLASARFAIQYANLSLRENLTFFDDRGE